MNTLMAAARCRLWIDGPYMNREILARFRAYVLKWPEKVGDIHACQFDNPVTVQSIAQRAAEIKARRAQQQFAP